MLQLVIQIAKCIFIFIKWEGNEEGGEGRSSFKTSKSLCICYDNNNDRKNSLSIMNIAKTRKLNFLHFNIYYFEK